MSRVEHHAVDFIQDPEGLPPQFFTAIRRQLEEKRDPLSRQYDPTFWTEWLYTEDVAWKVTLSDRNAPFGLKILGPGVFLNLIVPRDSTLEDAMFQVTKPLTELFATEYPKGNGELLIVPHIAYGMGKRSHKERNNMPQDARPMLWTYRSLDIPDPTNHSTMVKIVPVLFDTIVKSLTTPDYFPTAFEEPNELE